MSKLSPEELAESYRLRSKRRIDSKFDANGNIRCSICRVFLPPASFRTYRNSKHGVTNYSTRCRVCESKYLLDYFSKPENYLKAIVNSARKRVLPGPKASKRGHVGKEFNLTAAWVKGQYSSQEGKCYYTGIEMTFIQGKGRIWSNASIDRKNNDLGYTTDNCVLCIDRFNTMKNSDNLSVIDLICVARVRKMSEE